ncbi:YsnF/AvaK domain-containing protein [Paraburkholderia sediminicola]|uniref:YsnF/AvaK domain-containing protein n=1 Tax=Paraburkholderia sediminicola TaxID=458836 RepID=UPI0038B87869
MNQHDHPVPGVDCAPTTLIASEERLGVSSREHETGAVRIRTITHNESREIPVLLRSNSVKIERVEVNQFVDAEFEPRTEGDTLIVPVFEYVPVTELKVLLKEEIRITTVVTAKTDVHVAEVQSQQVVVERRAGVEGDWIADTTTLPSGTDGPD